MGFSQRRAPKKRRNMEPTYAQITTQKCKRIMKNVRNMTPSKTITLRRLNLHRKTDEDFKSSPINMAKTSKSAQINTRLGKEKRRGKSRKIHKKISNKDEKVSNMENFSNWKTEESITSIF